MQNRLLLVEVKNVLIQIDFNDEMVGVGPEKVGQQVTSKLMKSNMYIYMIYIYIHIYIYKYIYIYICI